MKRLLLASLVTSSLFVLVNCSKKESTISTASTRLRYSDSIFYLQNQAYTVAPEGNRRGTYRAVPDNLEIDPTTGKVTVKVEGKDNVSQTGLWYKIIFEPGSGGTKDSTYIMISGVNYVDRFYFLDQHQTIISPIYNGDPLQPVQAGHFQSDDASLPIDATTGQINIAKIDFNKLFNGEPWKKVTVKYNLYDKSGGVENRIDIILYNYSKWDAVPSMVSQIMKAHQHMTLRLDTDPIQTATGTDNTRLPDYFKEFDVNNYSTWKPRPPCVVIVGIS